MFDNSRTYTAEQMRDDVALQIRLIRYAIEEQNTARDDITLKRLARIESIISDFIYTDYLDGISET